MANGKAGGAQSTIASADPSGRWPANVILDEEAGALLDAQSGERRSSCGGGRSSGTRGGSGGIWGSVPVGHDGSAGQYHDSGGASRFFYCAKASKKEREAGLEEFDLSRRTDGREGDCDNPRLRTSERKNIHPTVEITKRC